MQSLFPGRNAHLSRPRRLIPLLVCLCSVVDAAAQDWPWWRGARRDGTVSDFVAPAAWPAALTQQWRVPVGTGDATPALIGDRLFVFGRLNDSEVISCLDARDGRELWHHAYPAVAVTGAAEKYAGPRSSLAVADGRVVALGVGGMLTCLEAVTGKLVWRHAALAGQVPRFFTAMSPLVVDDLVVVHLGGKDAGLLAAVALATGAVKWQWNGEGPAYASPALLTVDGTDQLVVQTEQSLSGFAVRNGRRLWRIPTAPRPGYWNSVTPVTAGPNVYYSGQGTGSRAVRIESQGADFATRELWHNPDLGTVYNTPVLKDGLLYALSDRGRFFCLDQATGATQWAGTERFSNFGAIVDAGGVLMALPEKSGLVVFQPGQRGFQETARHPVSDKPVYAHPVIAGRRIYVRDADSVALWTLGD
jgi:outer membrane protein assembly factor BamB